MAFIQPPSDGVFLSDHRRCSSTRKWGELHNARFACFPTVVESSQWPNIIQKNFCSQCERKIGGSGKGRLRHHRNGGGSSAWQSSARAMTRHAAGHRSAKLRRFVETTHEGHSLFSSITAVLFDQTSARARRCRFGRGWGGRGGSSRAFRRRRGLSAGLAARGC